MKRNMLTVLVAHANMQSAVDFGYIVPDSFVDCHPLTLDGYLNYMTPLLPSRAEMIEPIVKVSCPSLELISIKRYPKHCHHKYNKTIRGGKRTVANRREI
jgi:hypothetical protein